MPHPFGLFPPNTAILGAVYGIKPYGGFVSFREVFFMPVPAPGGGYRGIRYFYVFLDYLRHGCCRGAWPRRHGLPNSETLVGTFFYVLAPSQFQSGFPGIYVILDLGQLNWA